MKDERFISALGQPVEIGKTYGYSTSDSGFITVVVGEVIRFTPKKVTLEVKSRRYFLYGNEMERTWAPASKTVSVHGAHLFPVEIPL